MKLKDFLRVLAFLLIVILIPTSPVYAMENITELEVQCRFIDRNHAIQHVKILETDQGYYMTSDTAVDLLSLNWDNGEYLTSNGYVSVNPKLDSLGTISYKGEKWYRLEHLMTAFDTMVLGAEGELWIRSLPVNQDLLMKETERIMANEGYEADLLGNMEGHEAVGWFANVLDFFWKPRWILPGGKENEKEIRSLLIKILKHQESADHVSSMLAKGMESAEKQTEVILEAQKIFESTGGKSETLVSGGDKWLLGSEGAKVFRTSLKKYKSLDGSEIKISDILSSLGYIYEAEQIHEWYAKALERIFVSDTIKNMQESTIISQGHQALKIYNASLEENREKLQKVRLSVFTDDIVQKLADELAVKQKIEVPDTASVTKSILEFMDSKTLNVKMKNDSVRNMEMCKEIQELFAQVYQEEYVNTPEEEAALLMRDATALYLKTASAAYDTVSFDRSISGAVGRVQNQIHEELLLLSEFSDAFFGSAINGPLPHGCLSLHGVKDVPDVDSNLYCDRFYELLEEKEYLYYVENPVLAQELEDGYGAGAYYFHDVDRDGYKDLVLWLGCSGANGEVFVFYGDGSSIESAGSVTCSGDGIGIYGSDRKTGLILAEFDGVGEYQTSYDMVGGQLEPFDAGTASADGWIPLEPDGWLPVS